MTFYIRAQFVKSIVFTRSPYVVLSEAEQPEYGLMDDGPGHVSVTKGTARARVPWSNIASAVPGPDAEAVVRVVPSPTVVVKPWKVMRK